MIPYLTDDEIAHITAPLVRADARCRFLRSRGLIVRERPNGQPLIGRAHFEEWMGKNTLPAPADRETPDTAALLRLVRT
jgi:hypothetical protein